MSSSYLLRLTKEVKDLQKAPLEGIFVAPDEDDISQVHALVFGPSGTPYEDGFFFLSLSFPPQYPHKPPHAKFLTTDGDRVRFNPNLYANGKVCLSILGTWSGPEWHSSLGLGTVLLSIQSLMSNEPFKNEPGHENARQEQVDDYNKVIAHETLRVAVVGSMTQPTFPEFKPILEQYFLLNYRKYVTKALKLSADFDGKPFEDPHRCNRGIYSYKSIAKNLEEIKEIIEKGYESKVEASSRPGYMYTQTEMNIKDQYDELSTKPLWGVSVGMIDSNINHWSVSVVCADETILEGCVVFFNIKFNKSFPDAPPKAYFPNPVFHPNISEDGIPCLTELQEWRPDYSVGCLIVSIQSLLVNPNISNFVNTEAAELYRTNPTRYRSRLRRSLEDS